MSGALAGILGFASHLDRIMEATIPVGEAEVEAADAVRVLEAATESAKTGRTVDLKS